MTSQVGHLASRAFLCQDECCLLISLKVGGGFKQNVENDSLFGFGLKVNISRNTKVEIILCQKKKYFPHFLLIFFIIKKQTIDA